MSDPTIDIRLVDESTAVSDTSVDYIPFGVKVLKLQIRKVSGSDTVKVWIRTKNFKGDQDSCAIYGHADDGEDLWIVWGAGDVVGFCAKYVDQVHKKVTTVLDDDQPHWVYLHLLHRPDDPLNHQPKDHRLTIVAVTTGNEILGKCSKRQHQTTILAEKTFTLTVPKEATNHPIRPVWHRGAEVSYIDFQGDEIPQYVSRWWPTRQVSYQAGRPPRVRLAYSRLANGDEGKVEAWLENNNGQTLLAEISGHLTRPVHDLRWFVPELHRFYDGELYVLRLWFFWIDEEISADDLLSFVPEPEKDGRRLLAQDEAAAIMRSKFGRPGWDGQYEVPDVERFDIIFDPRDLNTKYGCTDGHWKEMWYRVSANQPFRGKIAAPSEAFKIAIDYIWRWMQRQIGVAYTETDSNPLTVGGLVSVITNDHYYYNGVKIVPGRASTLPPDLGPGFMGKNAPTIGNGELVMLSGDVLKIATK